MSVSHCAGEPCVMCTMRTIESQEDESYFIVILNKWKSLKTIEMWNHSANECSHSINFIIFDNGILSCDL